MPMPTRVQIICGNCAGFDLLPRPTRLTKAGVCWDCGGRSYVVATRLCIALSEYLQRERQQRLRSQGLARRITNLSDRRYAG